MRKFFACCIGMAVLAGPALAADAELDSARRCTQIKDSLERLVCFDKAFAAAPAPAAPPAARAAPAAPAALGDEQVKLPEEKHEAPRELDAQVTAVQGLAGDLVRVTLDNGQVWQQQQTSARFEIRVGDTLRIKKGALGSYRMARVSRGASGWVATLRLH